MIGNFGKVVPLSQNFLRITPAGSGKISLILPENVPEQISFALL
ncbi:hypothetical protein D082_20850 [Synechocystis sp. PCC 6714]|nr:hypothetical protein D082_20850 [Synechocystis sp. PCC 6714]